MKNDMSDGISCDVCMDLLPLVNDGIASEDSCRLVASHISSCEACAVSLGKDINGIKSAEAETAMDEGNVIRKIKKRFTFFLVSFILIGILIGLVLSSGMGMFYNALIMPAVGGLGYMLLKGKAFIIPTFIFVISFVWVSIREIINGFFSYSGIFELLIMSVSWAILWAGFSILGWFIGWLFHFAFKKETVKEK